MEIKNAIYKSEDKKIVDVEIEHPTYGWIPYTFNFDEPDSELGKEVREWLKTATIEPYILPTLTIDEQLNIYMNAVQNHLDTTAQKTKWDNMQSARACAGIPLDGTESDVEVAMHADAVNLARWYLKVWSYCYAQLDAIKEGRRTVPSSTEAFIEELPVFGA